MTDSTNVPTQYERSTGQHITFWVFWVLLLIPAMFLLVMIAGSVGGILLLPVLAQLVIHIMAIKWFLDLGKPVSKAFLMLLGGTGLLYFLTLGSCVVMLMGLSGANFH